MPALVPELRRPLRRPQRRGQDLRHDRLAGRLDDRPDRRHQGGHQPAVALDVERRQRLPARRARRGVGRPRRRRRDAGRVRAARPARCTSCSTASRASRCLEPEGAFYAFPNLTGAARPADPRPHGRRPPLELAEVLLDEAKVAIVPGEAFGAPGLRPAVVRPRRRRPGRGLRPHRRPPRRGRRSAPSRPYGSWPSPITSELVVRSARRSASAAPSTATTSGGPRAGPRRAAARGRAAAAGRRADRGPARRRGTPAPRCTSTAAARGGCATACCGSPTGPTSGSTASAPGGEPGAAHARARRAPRAALRRRRRCSPDGATPAVRPASSTRRRCARPINTIVRAGRPRAGDARGRRQRPRLRVRPPLAAPTARAFCWLEWDHPDMPWDATRLVVDRGRRAHGGGRRRPTRVGRPAGVGARRVALVHRRPHRLVEPLPLDGRAGGVEPDGRPRTRDRRPAVGVRPVAASPSSTAAGWSFATATDGLDRLAVREPDVGRVAHARRAVHRRSTSSARAGRRASSSSRASPTTEAHVARGRARRRRRRRRGASCRRATSGSTPAWFSVPEPIEFPTAGGAHRPRALLPADQPRRRRPRPASARRCSW